MHLLRRDEQHPGPQALAQNDGHPEGGVLVLTAALRLVAQLFVALREIGLAARQWREL